jgi:hypothetical protein
MQYEIIKARGIPPKIITYFDFFIVSYVFSGEMTEQITRNQTTRAQKTP